MLKKPSQLFEYKNPPKEVTVPVRNTTPLMENFTETLDRFKNNFDKVEELNEKVNTIVEDLGSKLSKEDLETAIFSHLVVVEENFKDLESQFKTISRNSLREFKENVAELAEVVDDLVEEQFPVYKKKITETEIKISQKFNSLQKNIEGDLNDIKENIQDEFNGVENVLSSFDTTLQETKAEVLETVDTYNKLRKTLENKISTHDDKIEEYSQVLENFNQQFIDFESKVSSQVIEYEKTFNIIVDELNESIENKFNTYDSLIETFKEEVNKNVLDVKADVVINEQHLKKVETFLQKNNQELLNLKEEVYNEIEKLPYGDIQENIERLNRKIKYIEEVYKNIEPEVIVKEVIQEGLPSTKTEDPLTPLDQNFVTLEQLQQHYRLFINRIQQQIATIGGGGETRLKYLDDIVGISTNPAAYDDKFLKYNHSIGKFEFVEVAQNTDNITTNSISIRDTDSTNGFSGDVVSVQKAHTAITQTTSPTSIHKYIPVDTYATAEFFIQAIKDLSSIDSRKILTVNNINSINSIETHNVSIGSSFVDYNVTIEDGYVNLIATPTTPLRVTYNIVYTTITRPTLLNNITTENDEFILTENDNKITTEDY